MKKSDAGQVTRSAAGVYEEFFVPALFQPWARRVVNAAAIQPGHRVLDVACGTGVVARAAAEKVKPNGSVTGLDMNESMLEVAARKAPWIEWRNGRAEALPFESNSFDAVVCQFGLTFFENPPLAIKEMERVLHPGGHLAVAVWAPIEKSPGYAQLADLLQRLFGDSAANALRAPFKMGDERLLSALFATAGVPGAWLVEEQETARFPSIKDWLFTEIRGWVLAETIDDAQFARLLEEADSPLSSFVTESGRVLFPVRAYIVCVTKPD
jgi:ubiquinone/menaquinone biosynthesis C-methylase UbiE